MSTAGSDVISTTASDQFVPSKRCGRCAQTLSLESFSRSARYGHQSYCRSCYQQYHMEKRPAAAQESEPETTASSSREEDEEQHEPDAAPGRDLYVFANSAMPGILKVGRSMNIARRAKELESGHPFRIVTRAACPGLGYLEPRVHAILQPSRRHGGSGREWFEASFSEVMHALACALAGED